MRKLLLIIFTVLLSLETVAQGVTYFSDNPSAMLYTLPQTSLRVKILVEKKTIKSGVYASFAQKYLGVLAPLVDKDIYTITAASVDDFQLSDPNHVYAIDASKQVLTSLLKQSGNLPMPISEGVEQTIFKPQPYEEKLVFTDLGLYPIIENSLAEDKQDAESKTLEEMAEDAAETIFTLRKRRFDLITGEVGENIFGAGLEAAIAEMKRIEDEYVALFMGKQSVSQLVREFDVLPKKGESSYVVTRFSLSAGFATVNDLAAEPIILELKPQVVNPTIELPRQPAPTNNKEVLVQDLFKYRVAAAANCRLLWGVNSLVDKCLPIYQFGHIVDVPVNIEIRK